MDFFNTAQNVLFGTKSMDQNGQPIVTQASPAIPEGYNPQPAAVAEEHALGEIELHDQKDPSFNCPDCFGEGLKDEYTICATCRGTGKI